MRFWEARTGGAAHTTTRHGHSRSRPLTLSPSRGRAGQRKRFSCGRHRCLAQRPKMEEDPAWPKVTARLDRQARGAGAGMRRGVTGRESTREGGAEGAVAQLTWTRPRASPPAWASGPAPAPPPSLLHHSPAPQFPLPSSTRPALRSTVALAVLFLATHPLSFVILAPPFISLELLSPPSKPLSSRVRTLG